MERNQTSVSHLHKVSDSLSQQQWVTPCSSPHLYFWFSPTGFTSALTKIIVSGHFTLLIVLLLPKTSLYYQLPYSSHLLPHPSTSWQKPNFCRSLFSPFLPLSPSSFPSPFQGVLENKKAAVAFFSKLPINSTLPYLMGHMTVGKVHVSSPPLPNAWSLCYKEDAVQRKENSIKTSEQTLAFFFSPHNILFQATARINEKSK